MEKSVVVYGPQGCGKTTHAKALAKHFGVAHIVDDARSDLPKLEKCDHLYLMRGRPTWADDSYRRVLPFDQACRLAGIGVRA